MVLPIGVEVVRGTIIGGDYAYYEFWQTEDHPDCKPPFCFKPSKIDSGHFYDDAEAESWLKEHYPKEYSYGVEMRCFE